MTYQPPVCTTPTFVRQFAALARHTPELTNELAALSELLTVQPTHGQLLAGTLYWTQLPLAAKPKAQHTGICWAVRRHTVFLLLALDLTDLADFEEQALAHLRQEGTRLMLET
jgi:hypothetical protein